MYKRTGGSGHEQEIMENNPENIFELSFWLEVVMIAKLE